MHAHKGEPALQRHCLGRRLEKLEFMHLRRRYLSDLDPTVPVPETVKPLPPLDCLRFFEAAARHRSFVLAGKELGVTSAAVGHRIRTLEKHLDAKLFERRRQGVHLNRRGRAYLKEVQRILAEVYGVSELQRATPGGCASSRSRQWPELRAFREWVLREAGAALPPPAAPGFPSHP